MQWALMVVGLSMASVAQAGTIHLSWEWSLAPATDVRFVLHLVTSRQGQVVRAQKLLTWATPPTCTDIQPPPHTYCASLCLDAGEYTLTVVGQQGGSTSPPSNELDIDLTVTEPCTDGPAPTFLSPGESESEKPNVLPTVVGGVVAGSVAAGLYAAQSTVPPLPALVNRQCVHWAITGPCVCGFPPQPCAQVEYWEPAWIVETVKRPGTTSLAPLAPLLDAALAGLGLGGGGAANAGSGQSHTNLQYTEVHIFTFPQVLGGPCTGCVPGAPPPVLHYASEIDPAWKTAVAVPSPTSIIEQIGVWAPLFPRGGKSIHGSEPVASGIAAMRAMSIAFAPIGPPPQLDAHVVLAPTQGFSTCCQLAWPKQTPCFTAGAPPFLWETAALSLRGAYVWIFHQKRSCCVLPPTATCGITVPGVGGHGANGCVIPSTP